MFRLLDAHMGHSFSLKFCYEEQDHEATCMHERAASL